MTADGKHSLLNRDNLMQPIQMQLYKKQKPFFQFFSPLMKSGFNFEDFQTNMTLIAYVFWKLPTAKDVVRQMSKKSYLERPFHKQHGKWSQTLLKYEGHHLFHVYWILWSQLSWKKFLLVTCKILELFVITLTANEKYSFLNTENLMQPIQMQYVRNKKLFLNFFLHFWNVKEILKILKKKMTLIRHIFPKL